MVAQEERRLRLFGRVEARLGHRAAVEVVGETVPAPLLDANQIIRIVENIATATHVGAVVRGPELAAGVELHTERISQAPCDELEAGAVRVEAHDGPAAFHIAANDLS